jgi:hypothetical protein
VCWGGCWLLGMGGAAARGWAERLASRRHLLAPSHPLPTGPAPLPHPSPPPRLPPHLQGMRFYERAAGWARIAAAALGVLAACAAAAARALTPGAALLAAAAVGAAWASGRIMAARHDKFINSINVWRRSGGLSKVEGAAGPIAL